MDFIQHDDPGVNSDATETPDDDHTITINDFEQSNFKVLVDEDDTENFILNPDKAVYTNARRVEVILLKILTELEAPLWAFKDIMDWACDAHQSGYRFMPEQATYKNQLKTIGKWVGMEHMRPTSVQLQLPGSRPEDKITVVKFDFISQFHSLLSDPVLNIRQNLVVNPDDAFSFYTPPWRITE